MGLLLGSISIVRAVLEDGAHYSPVSMCQVCFAQARAHIQSFGTLQCRIQITCIQGRIRVSMVESMAITNPPPQCLFRPTIHLRSWPTTQPHRFLCFQIDRLVNPVAG